MLKLSSCDVGMRHLFVYTNKGQLQRFNINICCTVIPRLTKITCSGITFVPKSLLAET